MITVRQGAARACRIESGVLLLCVLHVLCSAAAEFHYENSKGATPHPLPVSSSAGSQPIHSGSRARDLRFGHLTSADGLSHDALTEIIQDRRGFMWFATRDGLNRYDGNTFVVFKHNPDDPYSLSADMILDLIEDNQGYLWIGTGGGGVNRFDPQTERFTRYRHDPTNDNRISSDTVKSIVQDSHGHLWFATAGNGLNHFDRETKRFTEHFQQNEADPDSLNDDTVVSVFQDRSGLLWLGTATRGLNTLNFRQQQFGLQRHRPGDPNSLSPGSVTAVHQDRDGVLWVGYVPRALDRVDSESGQIKHYRPDRRRKNSLPEGHSIDTIYRDVRGNLWLGGWDSGLDRFDERRDLFQHFKRHPEIPHSLVSNHILAIYGDRSGQIWVGHEGGINRFNPSLENFTSYKPDPQTASYVRVLYQDRSGTIWLGTWEGELSSFDDRTKNFVNYTPDSRDPHKLYGGSVVAIHEDRSGTLWVGGDGLYRFDRQSGTFSRFTERQGLPSDRIKGILEDQRGRLWLSTKNGISRFDPQTGTFRNFDVDDGLQSNNFYEGAYKQGVNGEMFFGGSSGINAFFPEDIREDPYVPPVVITSLKIFNKPVPISDASLLKKAIPYVDSLTLSYRDMIFSLEFAALSYANSKKNRYRYKLEGLDPTWNEVDSKHRLATYTNLDRGKYVFRVQGSNSDGVWNEAGVSLAITVTPPWWNAWWFRSLVGLAVALSLWFVYTMRLRRVEQRNVELARQVAERTAAEAEIQALSERLINAQEHQRARIARELHDDFSQQIVGINLSLRTIRHTFLDPDSEASKQMESIRDDLNHLSDVIRELSHELHPAVLDYCDLAAALRTLCVEFSALTRVQTGFECGGEFDDISSSVALCIYRVAQEALRNVAKHAKSESAEVRLARANHTITLTVSDKGVGFLPNQARARGGLGIISIKEWVRLVNGTLDLQSQPNLGTTLTIEVPT